MMSLEEQIRSAERRVERASHSSTAAYWSAVRDLSALYRKAGR